MELLQRRINVILLVVACCFAFLMGILLPHCLGRAHAWTYDDLPLLLKSRIRNNVLDQAQVRALISLTDEKVEQLNENFEKLKELLEMWDNIDKRPDGEIPVDIECYWQITFHKIGPGQAVPLENRQIIEMTSDGVWLKRKICQ